MTAVEAGRESLAGIFWRFLRFGLLAWGGPVAQIAMIKRELVEEEGWVDVARFNRLLAVYQALPVAGIAAQAHTVRLAPAFFRPLPLSGHPYSNRTSV